MLANDIFFIFHYLTYMYSRSVTRFFFFFFSFSLWGNYFLLFVFQDIFISSQESLKLFYQIFVFDLINNDCSRLAYLIFL